MIVDIYREQYEFSCQQCGEIWRATYDVRQVEDGQGGVWHHYSRAGAPSASPAAGVVCNNCRQPTNVYQIIDRRRELVAGAGLPVDGEILSAIEGLIGDGELESSHAQGRSAISRTREQELNSPEPMKRSSRIVVGVDGSQSGLCALRWADAEALARGAELEIVVAWERQEVGFGFTGTTSDDFEREVRSRAQGHVTEALGRAPNVPYSIAVRLGRPAHVLVEAAQGADLLVIGANGHGALTEMLLGSVSEYCVHHASCSVVVVRDEAKETARLRLDGGLSASSVLKG